MLIYTENGLLFSKWQDTTQHINTLILVNRKNREDTRYLVEYPEMVVFYLKKWLVLIEEIRSRDYMILIENLTNDQSNFT